MASTTQKKTTTTKKSGSGKSGSSRSKKPAQPQKRPIRREVGGVVLLVLMVQVFQTVGTAWATRSDKRLRK